MAQMVRSMSELKRVLQNRASQALKMTRDEMFKVFQKHITEYYHEPVFHGSSIPKQYERLYKMLNSLVKTEVIQSGNEISCKVEVDQDYLNYEYPEGATGREVWEWANDMTHGGTVQGKLKVWNDAIDELGGRSGIMRLMKNNLKKCGVPIIN